MKGVEVVWVFILGSAYISEALIPNVQIDVNTEKEKGAVYGKESVYAARLDGEEGFKGVLVEPEGDDKTGCSLEEYLYSDDNVLLVERGKCTFQEKALQAQKAGAGMIIVYNSLEGVYAGRPYAAEIDDYECTNGEGWISEIAAPLWSTDNMPETCTADSRCESGK